jgi:DNA excision repair protein ERCC-2
MIHEPKTVIVALRDFAFPAPRSGSIESLSGSGRAAAEGREIHARIQARRAKAHPDYESEVRVNRCFDRAGFRFRIDGRMDGLFRGETVRIEEIKTTFNVRGLANILAMDPLLHPYGLQLLTYGYFFRLEHGVVPLLSFHLVSTRSRDNLDLELKLDIPRYERWLETRLDELVREAQKAENRAKRRRKAASGFRFPYQELRPGQSDLMETVEQGIAARELMLIQAPTGLGKTAAVLLPVLKDALGRGQRVFYVTPKNSQHSVAEDAASRFTEAGSKIRTLTITAKAKLCPKGEPVCGAELCEYADGYYTKVRERGLLDVVAKKRKLTARVFRELGSEFTVCPFELQLESAREADMVICDYNYVFAPRSAFSRMTELGVDQEGRPNLVIDETHNLPSRAMEYYSPSLSTLDLEQMRGAVGGPDERFRRDMEILIDGCIGVINACSPAGCTGPTRIDPPAEPFLEQDERLAVLVARYLESDVAILQGDPVLRLCLSWAAFTEALERASGREQGGPFIVTFSPLPAGAVVRITCCDASEMLKDCYDGYEQVVGFSATLKPFEYYAQLCGLEPASVRTAEFGSPFPRENRKIMVIPQISTKYVDRERNYARIAEAVGRIAEVRRGNYFAFFPSFEFLERTLALFQAPEGFSVLKQNRDMKLSRVEEILDLLRQGSGQILFSVQGGVFSEGVDYPGDMAIGAFVIGPPLPTVTLEREEMRAYYQRHYGTGFDYAYAIPAMAKAVQAAGRVIRSGTDRGLIVLMDSRFVLPAYSRSLPSDWFVGSVTELVSDSILRDVRAFWEQ